MENPSQSNQAQLCRNGCGFYGSPKNEGMCSLCYKDNIQKKNNSGRKSPNLPSPKELSNSKSSLSSTDGSGSVATAMASLATSDKPCTKSVSNTSNASSITIPSATDPEIALTSPVIQQPSTPDEASTSDLTSPSKPKKNRCATCRKRLGLTGFYCRCGNTYCSLHRYSDQHSCQFDYKADAQAKIRKENPVVVGEKINKI